MKKINILISGKAGNGNSYLVYEIRRLLRENGFNVIHDYNAEENQTEIDLDNCFVENLEEKINKLKSNLVINLYEKQLHRNDPNG